MKKYGIRINGRGYLSGVKPFTVTTSKEYAIVFDLYRAKKYLSELREAVENQSRIVVLE